MVAWMDDRMTLQKKCSNIRVIVMASGLSRRFGSVDKLLIPLNGRPMFQHVMIHLADLCRSLDWLEVVVVGRLKPILEFAKRQGFLTVYNNHALMGQSQSIRLGLSAPGRTYETSVFLTADQPYMSLETLRNYLEYVQAHMEYFVCVRSRNRWGNPVSFPQRFTEALMALEGDVGGKQIMKAHMEHVLFFEVSSFELKDIDHPSDLNNANDLEEI